MTSKERVLKTYEFKLPDRVPVDFCACEAVYNSLIKKLGVKGQLELMEALHVDFRWARAPWIGPELKAPDGTPTDYFGIPRAGVGDFGYPVNHPLKNMSSVEDIENYPWPSPDFFDYGVFREETEKFEEHAVLGGGWSWFSNVAMDLVGMEKFLILMYDEPDLAYRLMERICEFFWEVSRRMFEVSKGKLDIFFTGDDYGTQQGPLISLSMWRKLIIPHIKRLYSLAKSYSLKIMQHSCGSVEVFLPDLIEIDLDAIEPVQVRARGMDIGRLLKKYRGKLIFHGSIDTQHTLPFGNLEDVKREVLHRIELFKRYRGLVIAPSQHLLPEIPLENILVMYETAYEFGKLNNQS